MIDGSPSTPARAASRRFAAGRGEFGNAAIVTLLAVAITIVVFVLAANFVVDTYARGVLRTAVDEGALAGSLEGAPEGVQAACQEKEHEVMSGLLSGTFASGVRTSCSVEGDQVVATADGNLPAWLPPVPSVPVHSVGAAVIEADPAP